MAKEKHLTLPSFTRPPVNEVSVGLRFQPLQGLRIPHFGTLWAKIRDDYPLLEHAVPVAADSNILVDASTGAPLPRVWFISRDESHLVQLQTDRLHFNWRERGRDYPRYSHIIEKFETARTVFENFVDEFSLGPLEPVELELTYFNQIPRGQGWETNADLNQVFKDFHWNAFDRFLPAPDVTTWRNRFPLPDDNGYLTARLNQGKRVNDDTPVLVLEMSAKGMSKDKTPSGFRAWYDLAREWIVRGFADLTTDEMQTKEWGKQ